MTTMHVSATHSGERLLSVHREGIVFGNVDADVVHIGITVENAGDGPSVTSLAELWAAPLGAFVPWRPLAEVVVPALGPGQNATLEWWAFTDRPRPLGPPDRVPPRKLLTAAGASELPAQPGRRRTGRATALAQNFPTSPLPPDLLHLLGRPNPQWAGNLNVFVGGRPVERHLAGELHVSPGRVNFAYFLVGAGRDAYAFEMAGGAAAWGARLYDLTERPTLALDLNECPRLRMRQWIEFASTRVLVLALEPPPRCAAGEVRVHVHQRSSGQTAVVEFSLDPLAAGPGCFVV